MTHQEKFEELKKDLGVDDTCMVITNSSDTAVVYSIYDNEGNVVDVVFNLEDRSFQIIYDLVVDGIHQSQIQHY